MASITTAGTCQDRSQSASASTSRLVVPKLRVSAARRTGLASDGTRIVATSPALPISMPHTRSRYSGSSVTSSTRVPHLFVPGLLACEVAPPGEPGGKRKKLTRVLEATMNGPADSIGCRNGYLIIGGRCGEERASGAAA